MFSALKSKKNSNNVGSNNTTDKHNGATMLGGSSAHSHGGKKKAISTAQEGGYQHLRHIREIDGATKILLPIAVGTLTPPQCVDVVDHAMTVRLTPSETMTLAAESEAAASDCNMNGSKFAHANSNECLAASNGNGLENGNCNDMCEALAGASINGETSPTHHQQQTKHQIDIAAISTSIADDDESEHSVAACTSSSSEHSNSTVVLSPSNTIDSNGSAWLSSLSPAAASQPSPSKSLSSHSLSSSSSISIALCNSGPSSCSSSTSCDVTAIAASPSAVSSSSPSSPTAIVNSSSSSDEYVPAFLNAAPVTLPIIMPNGSSGLSTMPFSLPFNNGSLGGCGVGACGSTPANSAANTPKHSRYSKPRLSLSRFVNNSMPSVHGRPNLSVASSMGAADSVANGSNPPKRISTHQRNLSLDFRSMGIVLPPVSQVTNTRINLTQHHRNRSLDSALQRIPEVEVSSPNAESENTFCTPSILGTTMCSKIATTAASVTAALTATNTTPAVIVSPDSSAKLSSTAISAAMSSSSSSSSSTTLNATASTAPATSTATLATATSSSASTMALSKSNAINPSVIVDTCPTLRVPRPKSSETSANTVHGNMAPGVSVTNTNSAVNSNSSNSCKKREDLTSLGSDDSGILCGSDSDQISLHRIRHSHESLDSGEMDAEEECIDMLETTSMDEEYGMLQSDLCFYPPNETDCQTLRPSRNKKHSQQAKACSEAAMGAAGDAKILSPENERLRYREMNMSTAALNEERARSDTPVDVENATVDVVDGAAAASSPITPTTVQSVCIMGKTNAKTSEPSTPSSAMESSKNEIMFKNFFGATKNAIFRTAQSIIENHEKKNAAKNKSDESANCSAASSSGITSPEQIKSPTDISKKKEFFSLITSSSSKKAAAAAAAAAQAQASANNTPAATPTSAGDGKELATDCSNTSSKETPALPTEKTVKILFPYATANMAKSSSISSLNKLKVPGVVKCLIKERQEAQSKTEKGPSGLLRFFESPVFNIHFAVHYLFYSKEPGVLSFIGNKIFNFPDQEVDLYIPQLIVMYIQMDELAEVLDPYLTIRCRKSVDFSLKCLWLLEAYNYQVDSMSNTVGRKSQLALMKEIFSKKERKILQGKTEIANTLSPVSPLSKKTHHRSQSDATVLLSDSMRHPSVNALSISNRVFQQPPYTTQTLQTTPLKLCLGDLTSGRAFDNGCTCFETVRGQVNGLLGQKTVCSCGAPKTAPQKEFMKALINVGKNLTSLPSKAEKTSALRMFLNLINKNLPARVWLPLYSDIPHHVVRITEEKTAVLNSKDKTPYIIYVEVVEIPDIYSSPLIPKMMPSLRHTKSEENLECSIGGVCTQSHSQTHVNCSRTSSCSSHSSGCRRQKELKVSESSETAAVSQNDNPNTLNPAGVLSLGGLHLTEDDVWSQEDDDITAQYMNLRKISERDAISQMSLDSCDSRDQVMPVLFNIGDVRTRHCNNLTCENTKSFSNDPEDPSAAALKEPWHEKVKQIRDSSPYGHLSSWRLLSAIVKCGDDLRQELMATQLLQMFKIIWQEEHVDLWVRPYKIVCLSNDSGLIEPILNTVSLHQIKKNSNKSLRDYFIDEYGSPEEESFRLAQKNFVQSCAAYCLISYLLQVKDRHNGNILLHSDGHIIHIDFGFILSISPKNLGFEQSPFKLTPEFVDVMDGTNSELWKEFNHLLLVGMMSARKHMDRIINFVEIMRSNAQLPCFKNGCSGSVQNLRKRFHMNLTEQEMGRKVEQLVQDSLKSLSTKLYDGYQYYTNGIL